MESIANSVVTSIAEYGPGWVVVCAVIVLLWWLANRFISIYETSHEERTKSQSELVKISGQMTEQMERSNTVIENIQHEMSVMNTTNQMLVETLTKSQERSQDMGRAVHDVDTRTAKIEDKVEMMYHHVMTGGHINDR